MPVLILALLLSSNTYPNAKADHCAQGVILRPGCSHGEDVLTDTQVITHYTECSGGCIVSFVENLAVHHMADSGLNIWHYGGSNTGDG